MFLNLVARYYKLNKTFLMRKMNFRIDFKFALICSVLITYYSYLLVKLLCIFLTWRFFYDEARESGDCVLT